MLPSYKLLQHHHKHVDGFELGDFDLGIPDFGEQSSGNTEIYERIREVVQGKHFRGKAVIVDGIHLVGHMGMENHLNIRNCIIAVHYFIFGCLPSLAQGVWNI